MGKSDFEFDCGKSFQRIDQLILVGRDLLKIGVARSCMALLRDTVMEMPTVPLKQGTLRGSGSVFVDNVLQGTSEEFGSGGKPCTDFTEADLPAVVEGVVGFNAPYAAYQHEGVRLDGTHQVRQYSEPGSGAKFLEKKMLGNREKYLKIVGTVVKEGLA